MEDLYKHIEEMGKSAGYKNMTRLCEAADVNRALMSDLKMGRSKDISKDTAAKFANLLGCSMESVYGMKVQKNTTLNDESGISEKDARLIAWFRSLPQEKQKAILTAQDAPKDLL